MYSQGRGEGEGQGGENFMCKMEGCVINSCFSNWGWFLSVSWTWSSTFVFSSFISKCACRCICFIDYLPIKLEFDLPQWQTLSFPWGFYSCRSPGFLFIFNGTTCPASFKWICSLSPGFCVSHGVRWRALVESQKKHPTQAVQEGRRRWQGRRRENVLRLLRSNLGYTSIPS